jgi:hypothetical protein
MANASKLSFFLARFWCLALWVGARLEHPVQLRRATAQNRFKTISRWSQGEINSPIIISYSYPYFQVTGGRKD